jgi:hypothetical protein
MTAMSQPPSGRAPDQPPELRPPGSGPEDRPPDWGLQPPPQGRGGNPKAPFVVLAIVLLVGGGLGAFFLTRGDDGGGGPADDGGTEGVDAYVDALVTGADGSANQYLMDFGFVPAHVPCVARALVVMVGPENIPYTPAQIRDGNALSWHPGLTLSQGKDLYDQLEADCSVDWRDLYLQRGEYQGATTQSDLACIDNHLDDDLMREVFAAELASDQEVWRRAEDELKRNLGICGAMPA